MEAGVNNNLGLIARRGGTKEGAKIALECRDISNSIDDSQLATGAESNIILAKSEYEGSDKVNNEDLLKQSAKTCTSNVC